MRSSQTRPKANRQPIGRTAPGDYASRSAFTLLEIVTVIAIIGVITAILVPVFARSREGARRATCISNLRQIGAALTMYTSDNDGTLPPTTSAVSPAGAGEGLTVGANWGDLIAPDLGSATSFPFCPDRELPREFAVWENYSTFSGYAYNHALSRKLMKVPSPVAKAPSRAAFVAIGTSEATVPFPSLVVEVEETRTGIIGIRLPDDSQKNLMATITVYGFEKLIESQHFGAFRHGGGANYLFVDGHVSWYLPSAISIAPQCDGVHPGMSL